ncbi:MAG: AI-2E family transporter [Actinomycetota bacterium]|nr:AI-2E family transporter [Actinomycetota bacterium]
MPRLPAGERLRRVGIAAWSLIGVLILAAVSVWVLRKISIIFPPLVLAVLIIYLLNPIVSRLQRRGVPRILGTLLAYIVVLGGFTLVVIATIPVVSNQVEAVSDNWPAYRMEILEFVNDTAGVIEDSLGASINTSQISCLLGADETVTPDSPTEARCDEVTREFREVVLAQAGRLTEIGSSLLHALLVFVLGPLIAFYLLVDLPNLQRDMMNLVPKRLRAEVSDLGAKTGLAVGGFFRGQLVVALLVGSLSALGFYLIGLPFWFLIGAIAGFFNLIPLIGPYIGGALGFLVGVVSQDVGLGLKAALVELIVQQIDNHIISPNIMKRTVNLHPVTVMLSILAGGTLAGFWGVLLGVPAVAVGKLFLGHLWLTRVLGVSVTPVMEEPEKPPDEEQTEGEDQKEAEAPEAEVPTPPAS